MVLIMPLPNNLEDFPKPVDTSSQVGTLDEGKLDDPTLGEVPATYSPTIETPGPSSDISPLDIAHLCEEANKALGRLAGSQILYWCPPMEISFWVWYDSLPK